MEHPGPDARGRAVTLCDVPDDGRHDAFVEARRRFWQHRRTGSEAHPGTRRSRRGTLLAELVDAEYGDVRAERSGERPVLATALDLELAQVRGGIRADRIPSPEECVRLLEKGPLARATVAAIWPYSLRDHGVGRAASALRNGLLADRDPDTTAFLLDLATAGRLPALRHVEAARLAGATHRGLRHAAWRHLAWSGPGELDRVAAVGERDAYERLLLDALRPRKVGPWETRPERPGLLVAQTMLLGDLERPGEGLSGGLGVLLGALGDALAETERIAGVVTVVTACRPELAADPVLLRHRTAGHWVLRLPVDSDRPLRPEDMGRHREELSWWSARLLGALRPTVDVVHVRYSDDGSAAMAEAARRIGARVVFTATPDPHRQMTERHDTPEAEAAAVRHDLHRVFLADWLVARADRVVGIAGQGGGVGELLTHFPQLEDERGSARITAVPEGIAPYRPGPDAPVRSHSLVEPVTAAVAASGLSAPTVLLSVGRLHPVKQQDVLVRAWIASGCYRDSLLVIVGGSPERPGPMETPVRDGIERALESCPAARNRFLLLPALSNADVRLLERTLADTASGIRARYVCPSAKEEFGLAVLEAMDAGMLVAAPLRGGVRHYLTDLDNGLLLDTSCTRSLGTGLRRLLHIDDDRAAEMARRAKELVRGSYSVEAMARSLSGEYLTMEGRGSLVRRIPRGPVASHRIRIRS
ncbi:glycosyltransferase [Streptomyces sp. NPDC091368]|uniref:glycosyltransferase n=1 Tax=Streptomyces sp. NPDC091368 TaxID=3365993 RepID=UPI0038128FF9